MPNSLFLNNLNTTNVSLFSKCVTILLLLDNVFNTYGSESVSFSALFQAVCILLYILTSIGKRSLNYQITKVPIFIILYFVYLVLISFLIDNTIPLGYIKILLWYIVFYNVIDARFLLKSYQFLAVLIIGFFYIQEITHQITGVRILGFIPGLPLRLAAAANDTGEFLSGIATNSRSSSIFSEPAHLAQWLFPLLCIRLFVKKYYNVKKAAFIVLTLLLTKTGNAMFGLSAVGVFFVCQNFFISKNILLKVKGLIIIIFGMVAFYFYSNSSVGAEVMDRQVTLSVQGEMDKGYATSSFMRIYRGYFIYEDYNAIEKIFGNPSSDSFWQHAQHSGIATLFKENDTYMNTIHRVLIYTGAIGAILILLLIVSQWKHNTIAAKSLLVTWIVFSFISSGFFNGYTSIYLAFVYFLKDLEPNKKIS